MKDGHGRTIDYLRISLTDRGNYRCIYCMPEEGVQSMCNTDILRIEEIAHLHVRFIEYMPVGESSGSNGCGWGPDDVISCEELFEDINRQARAEGLPELVPAGKHQPLGWGPARYFEFPGAKGTVGFISPMSRHFCGECNRMRLTADGKLRPCLFSDREYDIRGILRSGKPEEQIDRDLADVFRTALGAKPDDHDDITGTERRMSQIGG